MNLKIIKSEGIPHNSYYLSDGNEAVVIDPRRDSEIYVQLAKQECAQIKYILETHRNEDYVVGSLELQSMTQAEIAHSNVMPFNYGEHSLSHGDSLKIGDIKIKTLHTPGHTNESLSYLVNLSEDSNELLVFTGDTLFAGSVGRTDLYGKTNHRTQAERLFTSLHEILLPLDDNVIVYPAHGAGSVCGHQITAMEPTTIGYEKKNNPYLKLSKEEFIQKAISEELFVPRYFKKMEDINLNGAQLLSNLSYPGPMDLHEFEETMQEQNTIVVDTRLPNAYAGSHIPNSLNLWLGGTGIYPGWILEPSQHILFVHERQSDVDIVTTRLRRLGFDNMCGYLCEGMNSWQEAGNQIRSFGTLSVTNLKDKLVQGDVTLLDVRGPREWFEDGYIEGAIRIFFAELEEKATSLPNEKPIAVTCSVGNRSGIALSILERTGFSNLSNVFGGMNAWTSLNYPTKKSY